MDAIQTLPERDQLLLNLYYEEELNLREIGAILEVSQSRVCQLHSQAISAAAGQAQGFAGGLRAARLSYSPERPTSASIWLM